MTPLPPDLVVRLSDHRVQAFAFDIVMDALDLSMALDWHVLLFGIEGLFELRTEEASWRLPPTRAACVSAGTLVTATTLGAVRCASVYLQPGFAEPLAPGLTVFGVTPVVREMVLHAQGFAPPSPDDTSRIERFYLTLLDLCRPLVDVGSTLRLPRAQSSELRAALRFTRANLVETLRIGEVAEAVDMSRRTLMRRLKDEIHMTWGEYLQSARMIRAMECLAGGASVTDTSIVVGYGSVAAFSTAFRRFTGTSPREYRPPSDGWHSHESTWRTCARWPWPPDLHHGHTPIVEPPMSPVPSPRVSSEIEAANRGGRIPVLFIHGLWVLPSSWASWAEVFEAQGYAPVLADWPGDPRSVQDARENPGVFGSQTVASTVEHLEAICDALDETPVIIGHSFGGLFAQMLAARGRSHRWALPWHPAHALGERAWCRQPERARARRSRSLPGAWA